VAYQAPLEGATRWVFDHRAPSDATRSTGASALVIDPPEDSLVPVALLTTSDHYVVLAQRAVGLGLYGIDAVEGTWTSVVLDDPALAPPRDGLIATTDSYVFATTTDSGQLTLVEVPQSLTESPLLTALPGVSNAEGAALAWGQGRLGVACLAGSPPQLTVLTGASTTGSWSTANLVSTGTAPGNPHLASHAGQWLVAWDDLDNTGQRRIYAQGVDDTGTAQGTPVTLGLGSAPQVAYVGTAWSVVWTRSTATSGEVVQQLLDDTLALSGAEKTLIPLASSQPVRTAATPSGLQATLWWDSNANSVELALCN